MADRRKAARTSEASDRAVEEGRKRRNRLSQRAFRERKAAYVNELEQKIQSASRPSDETITLLQAENAALRRQLLSVGAKLESMRASLLQLSQEVGASVKDRSSQEDTTSPEVDVPVAKPPTASVEQEHPFRPKLREVSEDVHVQPMLGSWPASMPVPMNETTEISQQLISSGSYSWQESSYQSDPSLAGLYSLLETEAMRLSPQLPRIWSHQYQMGPPVYREAIGHDLSFREHSKTTNSHFSDHLYAIKLSYATFWGGNTSIKDDMATFSLSVSMTLSLFNSLARPTAMAWFVPTKFYKLISNVIMWQIQPCRETYSRLPTRYRPTALQLMESYPPIIDWCPFASVRDRLISCHSANPAIDDIICDITTAYVVEANLSDLLVYHGPPAICHVRVWDIVQAITEVDGATQTFPQVEDALPAASMDELFTSIDCARQVFQLLRMDQGIRTYKLDPAFFIKYPELLGDDHEIVAQGIPLAPAVQTTMPGPSKLEVQTLATYRRFASWSMDVLSQGQSAEALLPFG